MAPNDAEWKLQRKNITKIVSTNTSVSVVDRVQEMEAARFLLNLLDSPYKLFDHIKKEAGSVILKITYGYTTIPKGNDPFVDLAGKTMEQFADATVPGRWSVDMFPFREYHPSTVEPFLTLKSAIPTRVATRNGVQAHGQRDGDAAPTVY